MKNPVIITSVEDRTHANMHVALAARLLTWPEAGFLKRIRQQVPRYKLWLHVQTAASVHYKKVRDEAPPGRATPKGSPSK